MAVQEIVYKKLEAADFDQVSRFRMSAEEDFPLQNFLRKTARKSSIANITQTYVAKFAETRPVIGYVTIMCAEIKLEDAYIIEDKHDAAQYDFQPAIRIARLAVADEHQGKGIGKDLIQIALGIALNDIVPKIGCRFLIVDAKQKSTRFYRGLGFRFLETDTNKTSATPLMFMDLGRQSD